MAKGIFSNETVIYNKFTRYLGLIEEPNEGPILSSKKFLSGKYKKKKGADKRIIK